MIVDCHTHWASCWQERDRGDPSEWLGVLDRHGVHGAFLMGTAGLFRLDLCKNDNDTVAAVAARAPERLIPLGSAWPQLGKAGLEEVRRCILQLRMKGLKFHPWVQGFSTADPVFGEMCALAGELRVPVFFHDGTPCYALSEQVAGLARRFPSTRFVLGHSGLLWEWRSAIMAAKRPNVWLCLCGPHMRAIEIMCNQCDPDRILWGTDFGFSFADTVAYRLELFQRAQLADSLKEKILGENPVLLLKS